MASELIYGRVHLRGTCWHTKIGHNMHFCREIARNICIGRLPEVLSTRVSLEFLGKCPTGNNGH